MLQVLGKPPKSQAETRKISCGNSHNLILFQTNAAQEGSEDVGIRGWGSNRYNQLGLSASYRKKIQEDDEEVAERAQNSDVVIDYALGKVAVFERPTPAHHRSREAATKANGSHSELVEVSCGSNHSAVLEKLDGDRHRLFESRLWTAGLNTNGQLGRTDSSRREGDEQEQGAGESDLPVGLVLFDPPRDRGLVVQRVCCGADHTLAIVNLTSKNFIAECGRVFAWGLGSYGALGTGESTEHGFSATPREVWFPDDVKVDEKRVNEIYQVAAGAKHSVALSQDGNVYVWGYGGHGRLGLGQSKVRGQTSYNAESEPRLVTSLGKAKVTYIAAGEAHTAAIDQLGNLYTWGQGAYGRCGHGNSHDMPVPARVESLSGLSMTQVALGLMHTVAMSVKGQLYACGKGPATGIMLRASEIIEVPKEVTLHTPNNPVYQIAAGPLHTVVLTMDGTMYCFGSATEGRLPFKSFADDKPKDYSSPEKFTGEKAWSQKQFLKKEDGTGNQPSAEKSDWRPSRLCCGGAASALLTGNGVVPPGQVPQENLWLWGSELISSNCDTTEVSNPETEAGSMIDWQGNCRVPVALKTGLRCRTVRMVALGFNHCIIVTAEDSMMYSWGSGSKGQLGTGSMQDVNTPQPITKPTDVLMVAAGEEHSACLIEGGGCFTWGNAEGGRLGLGGCLSDGEQLLPKRVNVEDPALAVQRSVSCGSQHSACITQDNLLLTFGTGWFGRLGHGDLQNVYEPKLVEFGGSVKEVYCGLYHSCIIDQNDHLWVCGRDSCLCREGDGHVLAPTLFEPFQQPGEVRCIQSLATSGQHTLVIAYQQSNRDLTELWVWGLNDRGQLGLPPKAAPVIDMPWQLHIPELQEWQRDNQNYKLMQVATGPHHSMCMVNGPSPLHTPIKDRREPHVFAWGYSGCGRLGLITDVDEKLEDLQVAERKQHLPKERTAVTGGTHVRIYPPMRVEPRWKPEGADWDEEATRISPEEQKILSKESSRWSDCQIKLFQEDPDQKEKKINNFFKEMKKKSDSLLEEIKQIWSKPASDEVSEYTLRQLQKQIEVEYVRTLQALDMGGGSWQPALEKPHMVVTDKAIQDKLRYFEELLWLLQQQPRYMAMVGAWLNKKDNKEANVKIYDAACARLFSNLAQPRVLHLFKSMLRLVIFEELEQAVDVLELFDPLKSRVASLITQMCTSPSFISKIALQILNPEAEKSLASIIIRYTLTRSDDGYPRCYSSLMEGSGEPSGDAARGIIDPLGVFATIRAEYWEQLEKSLIDSDQETKENAKKHTAQSYARELHEFRQFVITDEQKTGAPPKKKNQNAPPDGCIAEFIVYFVQEVLPKEAKDLMMLFVSLWKEMIVVNDRKLSVPYGFGATDGDESDGNRYQPGICTPLAALLLGSCLGKVLEALASGPFSLIRLAINRKVHELHRKNVDTYASHGTQKSDAFDPDDVAEDLADRVMWNISALGKFFQRCVHKSMFIEQYGIAGQDKTEQPKEESESRAFADDVKEFTCRTLLNTLHQKSSTSGHEGTWDEDVTPQELAADVYTSHFTLEKTRVSMSTGDMLSLANLLYRCKDGELAPESGRGLSLASKAEDRDKDPLHQLLGKIMPVYRDELTEKETLGEFGANSDVWMAEDHGEWHNFQLPSRFLEFTRDEEHVPILCPVSKAPMPRCFIPEEEQLQLEETALVQPMQVPREGRGPTVSMPNAAGHEEDLFAFHELKDVISELTSNKADSQAIRYSIPGSTFADLRNAFIVIQKQLDQDIKEGNGTGKKRAIVLMLEAGKKILTKIKDDAAREWKPKDLMAYIDMDISRRELYNRYLKSVKDRFEKIDKHKDNYERLLKEKCALLREVSASATSCDVPEQINAAAANRAVPITFDRVRRLKQKIKKTKPTPGQLVLEQMKNDTNAKKGKDEELRELIAPTKQYTFAILVSKGVVTRMNAQIHLATQRQIIFSFQSKGEGFLVQCFMKSTLLKEFEMSREHIESLENSNKLQVLPYADEFVFMNSFRLRRLLTWIVVEGGV